MTEFNINIKNLKFESMEVGRLIKSSKCIYTWEMELEDVKRKLELIHSRITGKRKIILDGKTILEAQKYTYEFTYTFPIVNHYLNLLQIAPDLYELKIDNITFTTLTNRENKEKVKKLKKDQGKIIETLTRKEKVDNKNVIKGEIVDNFFENKFSEDFDNKKETEKAQKKKKTNDDFFDKQDDWDFDFDKKENKHTQITEGSSKFDFIQVNKTNDLSSPGFNLNSSNNKFNINLNPTTVAKTSNVNLINFSENKPAGNNLIDLNDIFGGNKSTSNYLNNNQSTDNKLIIDEFNKNYNTKNNDVFDSFNNKVNCL